MRTMIEQYLVTTALSFAMRQLAKFGAETNWETVKADLAERIADLIPGTWLDQEGINLCNAVIDAIQRAFQNTKTLQLILQLAIDGKHAEAVNRLRDYLLKAWRPDANDTTGTKAMSIIEQTKIKAA